MSDALASLKALLDREIGKLPREEINGTTPDDAAASVELDIAYSPVIDERVDINGPRIPEPVKVQKEGARYCLMYRGDFRWIDAESLKVMRARYLLLRGHYFKTFNGFNHPDKQKILAWYFPDGMWRPADGSELAKAMGVV